jgi:hypothetical protein
MEDQKRRLAKAARIIRDTQRHNAAARKSHAKTRRQRLKKLGLNVEKMRCCIPEPSG